MGDPMATPCVGWMICSLESEIVLFEDHFK